MRCLQAFGERIAARQPDSQTAEIQIRVALMNRFSALGTAEIVRVGHLAALRWPTGRNNYAVYSANTEQNSLLPKGV